MSEFSIASDGRDPPEAFLQKARIADGAGCSRIWAANHLFQRDPIALAAMALSASRRAGIALMAMSPYTIHPVQLAMAAATLDEFYPGRVTLCLGSGVPADLASVGIDNSRPMRVLQEALGLCRALLDGESVTFAGETFRIEGRRLANGPRRLPLVMAASGPRMLELAGAQADGVLISAATSKEFVEWSLSQVARGADGRKVRRIGLIYASVDADARKAHERLRRSLAITLRGPHHAENLRLAGNELDQDRLRQAVAAEDWAAASRLITDRIVATHCASGTPDDVTARFRAYREAGLDEIVVSGVSDPDQLKQIMKAAGLPTGEES